MTRTPRPIARGWVASNVSPLESATVEYSMICDFVARISTS
ncbi:hypothetical protein AB0M40_31755 [Streptomyces hydrogenans]